MTTTHKPPLFTAGHYNALAKEIRELYPIDHPFQIGDHTGTKHDNMITRGTLASLAINLAKRFKKDNERFDPIRFLDACSPNVDLYPLSELWEEK